MAEEKEEKKVKAKGVSLWGQIIASVWIAGWSAFKFIKDIEEATITDFMISGFSIAGCFVPVYFNLIMDKIKEIRFGDTSNREVNTDEL